MNRIKNIVKRNAKAFISSAIISVVLLLICYAVDNMPYSFAGGATFGQLFEQVKQYINPSEEEIPDDMLFVNVAYDRQLAVVYDDFDMPKGNIDITDRSKLLEFLDKLKNSDYKYVILDISLQEEYRTPQDSVLFHLIAGMRDIVISKSESFKLADPVLAQKARYSDYSTHIAENNFVKYEFIRNGEATIPYQVYKDLYDDSITSFAGFYFFKGHLANRSIILRFPIRLWNNIKVDETSPDKGDFLYHNLGSDILDVGVDVVEMAKGKIVVVGDFCENDMHDTYLGRISGPAININALYTLINGNISIPYFEIIFLFGLYFVIALFIFKKPDIGKVLPFVRRIKSKTWKFIFSFVGLSLVLSVVALCWYIIFDRDINIFIPSLYFSILGLIVKYIKTIRSK